MATHKFNASLVTAGTGEESLTLGQKFAAFAESQKKSAMVWWLLSLIVVGGFLVPVTFLLVYSLNGYTALFLALSLISFFVCFVANMGGMSIKVCLGTFFFSLFLHLFIIVFTLINYLS